MKKLIIVLILFFLGCAGQTFRTDRGGLFEDLLQPLSVAQDYPDDGAVILLDEGLLNIFPSVEMPISQLECRRIVKIFDHRGFDFANITIPYSSSMSVTNIRARTITAEGKIYPVLPEQIYDVTLYPDFILYADTRAKRFAFPAVGNGCIVEYRYQVHVRGYTWWDSWTFQNTLPTRLSRYQVTAPAEWLMKSKCCNIDIPCKTSKVPAGFRQTYLWEAYDLPALTAEPGMPAWRDVQSALLFSPMGMKSWPDLYRWYSELIKDRIKPDKKVREKAQQLIAHAATDSEKLEALYGFVRDEVRYVAISIGLGGYQPHYARDIFRNRYGDCKDKVTLLQAMAGVAGLRVDPVLISTFQNGTVDTSLVSHIHFNHVIAHAALPDGKEFWLDPTNRSAALGTLPWFDQNRTVFVIAREDSGQWRQTPAAPAEANYISTALDMTIAERVIHGQATWRLTGAPAGELRTRWTEMRTRERLAWCLQQIRQRFAEVDSVELGLIRLADPGEPLTIEARFYLSHDLARPVVWTLQRLAPFELFDFLQPARQHPLQFRYPSVTLDTIRIRGLKNSSGEIDPFQSTHTAAEYSLSVRRNSSSLAIIHRFELRRRQVGLEEYRDFYSFIKDILRYQNRIAITVP